MNAVLGRGAAAFTGAAALPAIVAVGFAVADGRAWMVMASTAAAGIAVVALNGRASLLVLVATIALLQMPLGNIGSIPRLQLAELTILPLAGLLAPRIVSALRRESPADGARSIHVLIAIYGVVVIGNFIRTKLFMTDVGIGVNRAFYAYLVALAVYAIAYTAARQPPHIVERGLRVLYVLVSIVCVLSVIDVLLGGHLNLGNLRYSVYDYSTGAVRVGFLEIFGMLGLALSIALVHRHTLPAATFFAGAVAVSGGRSAAAGVVFGIVVLLLMKRRHLAVMGVAITAVVLGVAAPMALRNNPQIQRLTDINRSAFNTNQRALVFRESLRDFESHPIAGTGVGVWSPVGAPDPATLAFYRTTLQLGGHGTYISLLKNMGLLGFTPFVLALVLVLWRLARAAPQDPLAAGLLVGLVAESVALVSSGAGADPFYFLILGMAVAATSAYRQGRQARPYSAPPAT